MSPSMVIEHESTPRLAVDPLPPEISAQDAVFIQYRTDNLRVVTVFGMSATGMSSRVGHIHIVIDDVSGQFIETSGETVVVVELAPDQNHTSFELANLPQGSHAEKR